MGAIQLQNNFEVVYYSFPVPTNPYTITLLGILFDKIILPGIYLPSGQDKKSIKERLEFLIEHYDPQDSLSAQREMIGTLNFILQYSDLLGIFKPTGKAGYMGVLEPETEPVVKRLEEIIYGPPPPNFTPTSNMGFNQEAGEDQINGPSWISYPANALVFAKKNNLPLLSDSTFLPIPNIPALPSTDTEDLATQLMAASFSLMLPRIRPLKAEEILKVRERMSDDISVFRAAMLGGVNKYVELLGNNPTQSQLEKQAKHIAQTVILPKVEELRVKFESPKSIAMKKIVDLSLEAPELALNFRNPEDMPWGIIKVLSSVTKKVKEGLDQYQKQSKEELMSGLSLLLKIQRKYKKRGR
ncbi:hypothetical protein KKG24_05560 [Patescibacteria group bacterium]|nr:hypothetical protein [Patescibacteria group bacterium]